MTPCSGCLVTMDFEYIDIRPLSPAYELFTLCNVRITLSITYIETKSYEGGYNEDMTEKTIIWASLAWPSIVTHQSRLTSTNRLERGWAVGRSDEGRIFSYMYGLKLTTDWQLQTVLIIDQLNDRAIELRKTDQKWYEVTSNKHLKTLDGVPFIDISVSPFTNTLPIKQLSLTENTTQIEAIFFDENTFSLRKVQQKYSKLDDTTYKYQDVEQPDFSAILQLDEDGLIIDYEHLFKRL